MLSKDTNKIIKDTNKLTLCQYEVNKEGKVVVKNIIKLKGEKDGNN